MTPVDLSTIVPNDLGVKGSIIASGHFRKQLKEKGIPAENAVAAMRAPYKVTEVTRHPGQLRYCGYGVAVVMDGRKAITLYLDGVVTPLRPDQMHDKAALYSRRLARNALPVVE